MFSFRILLFCTYVQVAVQVSLPVTYPFRVRLSVSMPLIQESRKPGQLFFLLKVRRRSGDMPGKADEA